MPEFDASIDLQDDPLNDCKVLMYRCEGPEPHAIARRLKPADLRVLKTQDGYLSQIMSGFEKDFRDMCNKGNLPEALAAFMWDSWGRWRVAFLLAGQAAGNTYAEAQWSEAMRSSGVDAASDFAKKWVQRSGGRFSALRNPDIRKYLPGKKPEDAVAVPAGGLKFVSGAGIFAAPDPQPVNPLEPEEEDDSQEVEIEAEPEPAAAVQQEEGLPEEIAAQLDAMFAFDLDG